MSLLKNKSVFKPSDPLSDSDIGGNFIPVQCRGYSDKIKTKQKKKAQDLCKVGV
jgi:hypothetical protein